MITAVMDASAMTALLRGEAGSNIVAGRLTEPGADCVIHAVNLCEVYYDALRAGGPTAGTEAVNKVKRAGVTVREDMDEPCYPNRRDIGNSGSRI